jgi:hypothetical protein
MKGIMAWVKANLAIVILSGVIVVSLPTAFVASSMWNARIRVAREKDVNTDYRELETATVTYTIPAVEPGGADIALPFAPNAELTRWFKEQRDARGAQVEKVVSLATEINSAGHVPLVAGLFPEPSPTEGVFKKLEMAELIVGKEGRPSAYEALLKGINAGPPADPSKAASDVEDLRTREVERMRAERGTDKMTPEEDAALQKKLAAHRIGIYQRRANEISVYAGMDAFVPLIPAGGIPPEPKKTWEYFVWQWDYWVASDLVRAIGTANSEGGRPMPLERAPVKRLLEVKIADLPIYGQETLEADPWTPTPGLGTDQAPLDPHVSVTGRRSSKFNKLYDVRKATMTIIADSSRLTDVIDAISRTNFMTVIGLNVGEVSAWKDLDDGFYYGPAHVVRAEIEVETVWLRSWTARLMPDALRIALAMEPHDPNAAPASAPAAPPPPPRTASPRNQDDDLGGRRGLRGGGGGG